ncbi:hypothetical protein G6F31_019472 [Rhizopus arrhizus]|nr:hypothetical protein G6F32_017433 [Rhizopus arrhizus]KAG0923523.1 hypothetical protein G6F31_019472 [Rhizopus arrhizus]
MLSTSTLMVVEPPSPPPGPSAAITMALPISSWLCATWSRVSGGISLQPGEPSDGGMSRYFISEVTWPPSALA